MVQQRLGPLNLTGDGVQLLPPYNGVFRGQRAALLEPAQVVDGQGVQDPHFVHYQAQGVEQLLLGGSVEGLHLAILARVCFSAHSPLIVSS